MYEATAQAESSPLLPVSFGRIEAHFALATDFCSAWPFPLRRSFPSFPGRLWFFSGRIVMRSRKFSPLFLSFLSWGHASPLPHPAATREKKSDNFCTAGYFLAKRCLAELFSPSFASSSCSLAAGGISALSSRVALYGVLISIYNLICFIPFHLLRSRKEEGDREENEGGRLRENSSPPRAIWSSTTFACVKLGSRAGISAAKAGGFPELQNEIFKNAVRSRGQGVSNPPEKLLRKVSSRYEDVLMMNFTCTPRIFSAPSFAASLFRRSTAARE